MQVNNPLYKKQGVHLISSIFTVENGDVKVLLIKRKNEPFKNMWALVGGALYNNETIYDGMNREILEKTGLLDVELFFSGIFSNIDRSPLMRMIGISFVGILDSKKYDVLKETVKTSDSDWVKIDLVNKLAYDHDEIFKSSLEKLKELIYSTNILRSLLPNEFSLPEIQYIYESILKLKFDRRNFRKKIINMNVIEETGNIKQYKGSKPAKLYKFK